jgi:hypothetical protein
LSVVPISVCPSHGSTKIVRPPPAGAIAPATTGSVAPSTMMCVPRLGRITGTSASSWSSPGRSRSAHTPVALTTLAARTSSSVPDSASRTRAPTARPPSSSSESASTPLTATAPKRSASASTVSTSRASSVWQS